MGEDSSARAQPRPLSPLVDRIGGAGAAAWDLHREAMAAKRRGEDVIVLSVGDPEFATPAPIVDAAVGALRAGETHYTPMEGYAWLRETIARRHAQRSGRDIDSRRVVVVAGAQNGLFASALCLCGPGDEVIVPSPMYVTYEATIGASGARLVAVDAPPERGFRPDPHALDAAVTPATRAVFLANPNNPTGVALARGELEAIAEIVRQHDLWLVADEVYADLVFERPHTAVEALPGMDAHAITVSSLSKSHAMTGWRLGWVIAPLELTEHFSRLALAMLYGVPGFIQAAANEALTGSDHATARMRDIYRARRDLVARALARARGLDVLMPEAGMFALVDVRGSGRSSAGFARALYAATGVAVLDARAFGRSADGFVRLSFSVAERELEEACARIVRFAASGCG